MYNKGNVVTVMFLNGMELIGTLVSEGEDVVVIDKPMLCQATKNGVSFTPAISLTGDVVGDLNGKRARILGMLPNESGSTVIEAEVPQVEMLSYSSDLRSQTQGRGSFSLEFRQYEQVPEHLVSRVVESTKDSDST